MPDHFDHLQLEAGVEYPSFLLVGHVFRFRGDFHLSGCLGKLDHYKADRERFSEEIRRDGVPPLQNELPVVTWET